MDSDKKMIRLAFDMAVEAHSEQRRKSGEAYIFHPISVAKIVAEQIGLDATSICAALLHDVAEDTKFTLKDIEQLLGENVAKIVHGLTKISNLKKDKGLYTKPLFCFSFLSSMMSASIRYFLMSASLGILGITPPVVILAVPDISC